jgi:UDP-N-acetylglucosamine--N-acetylmuramyl-(pentapeptide) pyrophosphoryl-undecaprenol N-acetylglucosamine transferase
MTRARPKPAPAKMPRSRHGGRNRWPYFPGPCSGTGLRERGWRVQLAGRAGTAWRAAWCRAKGFALRDGGLFRCSWQRPAHAGALPVRLLRACCKASAGRATGQARCGGGAGRLHHLPGRLDGCADGQTAGPARAKLGCRDGQPGAGAVARRVFTAFPKVLAKGQWVGNPLRAEFLVQAGPQERFANRTGPLRVLVVGGSLGAAALNTVVPQALALIPEAQRPLVTHQSGEKQLDALRGNYAAAGVQAELTPFIDNTAQAFADADWVICRAGASTVTEIAAVGAAALFVPFPLPWTTTRPAMPAFWWTRVPAGSFRKTN